MEDHKHGHIHGAVSVCEHEGALAGSFEKDSGLPLPELEAFMRGQMEALARTFAAEGALIGHIKAVIKGADEAVSLSITKNTVNTKRIARQVPGGVSVSLAAILFNIDREQLELRLWELYRKIG